MQEHHAYMLGVPVLLQAGQDAAAMHRVATTADSSKML